MALFLLLSGLWCQASIHVVLFAWSVISESSKFRISPHHQISLPHISINICPNDMIRVLFWSDWWVDFSWIITAIIFPFLDLSLANFQNSGVHHHQTSTLHISINIYPNDMIQLLFWSDWRVDSSCIIAAVMFPVLDLPLADFQNSGLHHRCLLNRGLPFLFGGIFKILNWCCWTDEWAIWNFV